MEEETQTICGTAEVERVAQVIRAHSGSPTFSRRLPIGAEFISDQAGSHFRVWAPATRRCQVELLDPQGAVIAAFELHPDAAGYFSGANPQARAGSRYRFRLDDGSYPDPASRFQPEGPHGPSVIVNPSLYQWTDHGWTGIQREGQIIYEIHVGTFTAEGTWRAAMDQLEELASLGITVIEMMPIADFPGRFGWGYDGVNLFSPTRLYGSPDDLRAFIDRAHALGIGVILDVVYNHLGPDGNYLPKFSADYFNCQYQCEWGEAINFDAENSEPVREFFVSNAAYWIDEFHFDGLRLDATQQIFDSSDKHVISEITAAARAAAGKRSILIVAENEPQNVQLAREFGVDALWNDDFHHSARVAATGRSEAYYSDYKGTPQEFISAAKWGYLYQGQWYEWQKKNRGTPALDLRPANFITFIQNHDQVANSLVGNRIHRMAGPGKYRALTALLLLGPGTPMLFQGQEFASAAPFLYFADHGPDLARLVSRGRREFLMQFDSIKAPECDSALADPESEETFRRCILDFSERERNSNAYALHRDLLALRRNDPVFSRAAQMKFDGAVLSPEAFLFRYFSPDGQDRLVIVNFGADLRLVHAPEPLLAPPAGAGWRLIFSTESVRYGGGGTPALQKDGNWWLPGHATIAFAPIDTGTNDAKTTSDNRPQTRESGSLA